MPSRKSNIANFTHVIDQFVRQNTVVTKGMHGSLHNKKHKKTIKAEKNKLDQDYVKKADKVLNLGDDKHEYHI